MSFVFLNSNISSATISAPPTTNIPGGTASTAQANDSSKASSLIPQTGTTSKIMHPPEDISLEEIRARKPKYLKRITTAIANAISFASSVSTNQNKHVVGYSGFL